MYDSCTSCILHLFSIYSSLFLHGYTVLDCSTNSMIYIIYVIDINIVIVYICRVLDIPKHRYQDRYDGISDDILMIATIYRGYLSSHTKIDICTL